MKHFDPKLMSHNMKALRKQAGLTLEQVGIHLGVTKQAVWALEKHPEKTCMSRLLELAELYGCNARDFFTE